MRRHPRLLLLVGVLVLLLALGAIGALVAVSRAEDGSSSSTLSSEAANMRSVGDEDLAKVQGAPNEVGGEPFRTCTLCHADYLQKPDPSGDLIFSHKTHLDNDVKCVTCHQLPLGHFNTPAPMMMTCLECHQGETAPNDCKNCHRKLEEIAPGLGVTTVHLDPDAKTRKTCEKCHDVKVWCEKCHGVEMPHPATWRGDHGKLALEQADVCVKCHQSKDKTFCISCHGVQMPHPAYWYSGHGDIAKRSPATCYTCHPGGKTFCQDCHHAGFSPTAAWPSAQHGRVANERGQESCLVCHQQSFCTDCHTKTGSGPR